MSTDDQNDAVDEDVVAMQQMMGFSTFSGAQRQRPQPQPPRKKAKSHHSPSDSSRRFGTGANREPVAAQSRASKSSSPRQFDSAASTFIPASLPPRPDMSSEKATAGSTSTSGSGRSATVRDGLPQRPLSDAELHRPSVPATMAGIPGTEADRNDLSASPSPPPITSTTTTADAAAEAEAGAEAEVESTNTYRATPTGKQYTPSDLAALAAGRLTNITNTVLDPDGQGSHDHQVRVYFQPSFVASPAELWEDLERRLGLG